MIRISYQLALAWHLIAMLCNAATYYVATDGDDSRAGSAAAPYRTVMRGVDAAGPGDTILVRDGTYYSEAVVSCGDDCDINRSPVVISKAGTPEAPITIKSEHKWGAVLDCKMLCDSYINLYNSSYIIIQDFVITHGYKEGIHSNDAAHHITLRGNRIEYIANRATTTTLGQDGMYTNQNCHDFIIDGNVFHDIGRTNENWLDHGLYLHGANYTIINNVFYNMSRGWSIQAADGLTNVLIANNTFAFPNPNKDGHIILWNTQAGITIRNNIFYGHQTIPGLGNLPGHAITRWTSTLDNCSIDHNIIYGAGEVIADQNGCLVTGNLLEIDPQFVHPAAPDYNFHLQAASPAIDAGASVRGVSTDFDGTARPQGSGYDIGAYEFSPSH